MDQPERDDDTDDRGRSEDDSGTSAADAADHDAVDETTSEVLGHGVRRDAHGEIAPDPYPAGDEDRPDPDVMEAHREDAAAIEQPPGVGRAAADTPGMGIDDEDDGKGDERP